MDVKILCLGDLHITLKNPQEIRNYFKNLSSYLETHKVDLIVVLGDTLDTHNRLYTTCLMLAIDYINLLLSFAPVYILVGNHDMVDETSFLSADHWLTCFKDLEKFKPLTIVDNIIIQQHSTYKLVFCPYVPDGRFIEALNTKKGQWENATCIFSHVTIKNAKMNSITAQHADEWNPSYPLLISGHIHESQWIGHNMYYTGSIMQVAINEPDNKHIALLQLTQHKQPCINEIYLAIPKKKIIKLDIASIDTFNLPTETNTKYSIYIHGNPEQFHTFTKSLTYKELRKAPNVINIRFQATLTEHKLQSATIEKIKANRHKQFIELLKDNVDDDHDILLSEFYKHLIFGEEDITENLEDILII